MPLPRPNAREEELPSAEEQTEQVLEQEEEAESSPGDRSGLLSAPIPFVPPAAKGLKRIAYAWNYSWAGLRAAWREEAAFREEVLATAFLLPLALILPLSWTAVAFIALGHAGVLVTELLNSAIEWAVDHTSQEEHDFARKAKDMASGAVLVAITFAAFLWGLSLWAHREALSAWLGF